MVGKPDSKVTVSRRAMLATGGVVLAAAGVYAVFGEESKSPESRADKSKKRSKKVANSKVEALRKNFSYLKLDTADLEKYVTQYEARFGRNSTKKPNKTFFTTFLLSSDFFLNGAKLDSPVKYLALHDPAKYPCQNPFARYD